MASFDVSLSYLQQLAALYRQESLELRERSLKLLHASQPLVSDWPASSPLRELANDVEFGQKHLVESLQRMADVLENAAAALQSTDDAVSRAFNV